MSFNCDKYQELATFLDEFQVSVTGDQLDTDKLRICLSSVQEFFVQQIVPLVDANAREQSCKTEISKQLRLLEVDMMFLQGARQLTTSQARLKTIEERINTLISYCQAIIRV